MSTELFERILDEARTLNISEILLFLNGEPLVFPYLFDWLEKLREGGFKTTLFTNANALTLFKSLKLISFSDVIHTIVFSVAGIDKASYQEIMGLDYETVRKNIEQFINLNRNRIKTVGHCPYFSKSVHFQQSWTEHWNFISEITMTSMFNFAGLIHDELELAEDEKHHKSFCERLNHLTILWDGRVCLCCADAEGQVILGDANQQSLIEIFNSELAKHYRDKHRQGKWDDLPLCRDCNMNIIQSTSG